VRRAPSGCAASTTRWSVAQPRPPVQSRPSLPAAPGRESRRTLPRERGSSSTRSTWKLRVDLRAECRVHRTPNMPVYTAATSHGNKNPDMLGAPASGSCKGSFRFAALSTAPQRGEPPRREPATSVLNPMRPAQTLGGVHHMRRMLVSHVWHKRLPLCASPVAGREKKIADRGIVGLHSPSAWHLVIEMGSNRPIPRRCSAGDSGKVGRAEHRKSVSGAGGLREQVPVC
jgi:hypothetical protein